MTWERSLNDDLSPQGPPSGSTRHLRQKLKDALAGSEIGEVEADVGVDGSDQRDIREIEALGDHLCAQKDVDLSTFDPSQDVVMGPFGARGVNVHAGDAGVGENFGEHPLDLLGPNAPVAQAA